MAGSDRRHLTAQEAADALGVTRATLYAYRSRGQLRSEPVPGQPRERRYYLEDIERLRERKEARRDPSKAAARGLHWGSPVLESGITLIHDGRLYYRGLDVLTLAEAGTLEELAEVLWSAQASERGRLFEQRCVLPPALLPRLRGCPKDDPLSMLQVALPLGGAGDPASHDLRPEGVRLTGARIVRLLTAVVVGRHSEGPVHRALRMAWAPRNSPAGEAIRMALILCADHELNASAFVARCAASAGASPYDVVSAALATLKGHRHGGATERLSALFQEVGRPERSRTVLANRLRRGESLPGFGHPLYPTGDPRAAMLLQAAEAAGNKEAWRLARSLVRAGSKLLQARPNLDFGLVAVARAYGLPDHAPLVLFALGRTIGWIAHAIEQYASTELIRPRARYTGPPPDSAAQPS
jgi:citrate synthase